MTRKHQQKQNTKQTNFRLLLLITLAAVTLVNITQSANAQAQDWINPDGGSASVLENWNPPTLPLGDLRFNLDNEEPITITFDEQSATSNSHVYYKNTWNIIPQTPHTITGGMTVAADLLNILDGQLQVNGDIFINRYSSLNLSNAYLNNPANPTNLFIEDNSNLLPAFIATNSSTAFLDNISFTEDGVIEVNSASYVRVQNSIEIPEDARPQINVNSNAILIVEQNINAQDDSRTDITIDNGTFIVDKNITADFDALVNIEIRNGGTLQVKQNLTADPDSRININIDGGTLDVNGSINTGEESYYSGAAINIDRGTINVGEFIYTKTGTIINGGTINANFKISGPGGLYTMRGRTYGTFINGGRINGTITASEENEGIITGGNINDINLTGDNDWQIDGGFVENFNVANTSTLSVQGGDIANLSAIGNGQFTIYNGNVDLVTISSYARAAVYGGQLEIFAAYGHSYATINNGTFFGGIVAGEQAYVHINDGDITEIVTLDEANTTIFAGQIETISAMDQSNITLNLKTLDTYQQNGGLYNNGYLQGTWADDTQFAISLRNDFGNTSDHLTIILDQLLPDANQDNSIDLIDLQILGQNFGLQSDATFAQGDFNGDGIVSLADLDKLGQFYGLNYQTLPPPVALPEPSSLALLLSAAVCLTKRRKRTANTTHLTSPCNNRQNKSRTSSILLIAIIATLSFTASVSARTLNWYNYNGDDISVPYWLPTGEAMDDDPDNPSEIDDDLIFDLPNRYTITNNDGLVSRSMSFVQGNVQYLLPYSVSDVYDSVYIAPTPGKNARLQLPGIDGDNNIWQIHNALHVGGSNLGQGGNATLNLLTSTTISVFGPVRVWPGSELNMDNSQIIADTVEILGTLNFDAHDYDPVELIHLPYGMQANLIVKQSGVANITGGHFAYGGIAASGSGQLNFYDGFAQQIVTSMNSNVNIGNGEIPLLVASANSSATITGGDIDTLIAYDDATISIFANNITISPAGTGKHGDGFITGTWDNGDDFTINLLNMGSDPDQHIIYGGTTAEHIITRQFTPGDINADGEVSLLDLDILGENFGKSVPSRLLGDLNSDGIVSLIDLDILGQNYQPPTVPEPATLTLITLASILITRRK